VDGQGGGDQGPGKARRSPARTWPVAPCVEAALGSLSRFWRLRSASLGSTSSQPGSPGQAGDTASGPPERRTIKGLARDGKMDTSRRPDGPLDSRIDRQVRQLQGLQVMTRLLNRIPSRIPASDTIDSPDGEAITRNTPRRSETRETDVDRGWQRPPAWRLGASDGRRRRASGTADRGLGTVPHTQPGPTSTSQHGQYRRIGIAVQMQYGRLPVTWRSWATCSKGGGRVTGLAVSADPLRTVSAQMRQELWYGRRGCSRAGVPCC
jgi:hypothetical protein